MFYCNILSIHICNYVDFKPWTKILYFSLMSSCGRLLYSVDNKQRIMGHFYILRQQPDSESFINRQYKCQ